MKPAIEIRNLGKEYTLASAQPYISLRDVISGSMKNIFQSSKRKKEKFWALQDINADIMPGERVGIIGRNGAGKSTLLKIISRITPPTTGEVIIRGRVGSLLEVGTGFHPELTGRENIYLNGSILGLKRVEITKQLDEIIDFSGVEKFIDTPLKHYSSGMQLRLAFSVAAHLEPEILLIDEVLAVGDMEFQKKCLGKMEEVSKNDGRTILFVSHNIGAIQTLCNKSIYLTEGKIRLVGETNKVIENYSNDISTGLNKEIGYGNKMAEILDCKLLQHSKPVVELLLGHPASIELKIIARQFLQEVEVAFNLKNIYGEIITHSTTLDQQELIRLNANEQLTIQANLSAINPAPGTYLLDIFVLEKGDIAHAYSDYLRFNIINSDKALRPAGFPSHIKTYTETKWQILRHENI